MCATSDPNLLRLLFACHQQNRRLKKHYLQAIGKMSEFILQAVGQGGVARAEFSTDVTFSQWFCFLIMLVHRCDRCCVYKKEVQPCRAKYRGIWAILMHKMILPSESCNSVSKGTFREFPPFSVIAEMFSPRTPFTTSRTPVWEPGLRSEEHTS